MIIKILVRDEIKQMNKNLERIYLYNDEKVKYHKKYCEMN